MLVTEEEAERQACIGPDGCGVLFLFKDLPASRVEGGPEFARLCIASACKMAWRWKDAEFMLDPANPYGVTYTWWDKGPQCRPGDTREADKDNPDVKWEITDQACNYQTFHRFVRNPARRGYCGLAGKQ